MLLERLTVDGLRSLREVSLQPVPGINFLQGANGAGKSSVLEACYLLSYGRSFRRGNVDSLICRGRQDMQVFAEILEPTGQHRLGLGRRDGQWQLRVDGQPVSRVSDVVALCAVVCFEPGSHALINGPAELRRQFLDWGVFHVEHGDLAWWSRYRRALRQRNALLRRSEAFGAGQWDVWESELAVAAGELDRQRTAYLALLEQALVALCSRFLPELGALKLSYRCGWDVSCNLAELLREQRQRDRDRGYTLAGAHRADWRLLFEQAPRHEHLSRGQEKLAALACVLAQACVHAQSMQSWPLICLDDLASELDVDHQAAVVDFLVDSKAQVLLTGTEPMPLLQPWSPALFHVEQGRISRAS
ncbi:MAG TPA: DNA replication/repair protein RecF [Rhodanobacteraceae bacterium]